MAKNQLRDYDKKFLKNDRKKEMSEEEFKKLLEFNIDEFDYTPTEKELSVMGAELQEKEEPKKLVKAVFGSFPYGLRIAMITSDKGKPGKEIAFNNGRYETSNQDEIKFLKEKAKRTYPGQTITLLQEIHEEE